MLKTGKKACAVGLLGLVLAIQIISLFRTLPSTAACGRIKDLGHGAHVLINCDSAVFMKDAQNPERFINGTSVYQDRPLYGTLNWVISETLIKVGIPNHTIPIVGNSGSTTYYSEIFYFGYLIINFAILGAAVLLILESTRKDRRSSGSKIVSLLATFNLVLLVSANELTKTFFWTPHSQMFNLLLPAMALFLIQNRNRFSNWKFSALTVSTIGVLLFFYSLLAILFVIVIFAVRQGRLRRLTISIAAALPYLLWPFLVGLLGGSYHNINVTRYKEFIWIYYSAVDGTLVQRFISNEYAFTKTLPCIPIAGILIAFIFWFDRNRANKPSEILSRSPKFAFFLVYIFIYSLMGYYARRVALGPIVFAETIAFTTTLSLMRSRNERIRIVLLATFGLIQIAFWVLTCGPMQ
jgi:hypothetical protein